MNYLHKNRLLCLALISALLLFGGCATSRGFDRGSLGKTLNKDIEISDAEIERVLSLKPQVTPFKLGVYFNPLKSNPYGSKTYWTGEDKALLDQLGEKLIKDGVISQYVPIVTSTVGDFDLKSVRLAAARHGVDAVLVINGVSDIDRYNNNLGVTYILLVTAAFVPGTVTDSLFLSNATLWDVKNEYLYLTAEAEGTARTNRPALATKENQVAKEAKRLAVEELTQQLYKNISSMK